MKRIKLSIALMLISLAILNAQESSTDEFVPHGQPTIKVFSNAHSTFTDGDNTSAFELKRAYLGYKHSFSKHFSTKVVLDVGNPKDGGGFEMTAYIKNAALTYNKNNLKIDFGLIGLYGFKAQEKHWGYRYIYKSFQDEHKFGSSADLGTVVTYKFADFISADVSILNGEGYKKLQSDDTYKGALGITITPIKNLNIRAYYDNMSKSVAQQTLAFFVGYKADAFKVGAEYNRQMNTDFVEDQTRCGLSAYTTVNINKKFNVFGRFDNLRSLESDDGATDPWNIDKDGQLVMLGLEYRPVKGIKLSPNFQGWNPKVDGGAFESSIYLNVEISF